MERVPLRQLILSITDRWHWKGRLLRPFLIGGMALVAAGSLLSREPAMAERGRIRPPAASQCDRNQLTSYSGRVSGYKPGAASTWIEISTDEDTIEAVIVPHGGEADASARYLLRGEAFTAKDWPNIEASAGKLVSGMRVVAWVCLDGKTEPLIDWQPASP